MRKCLPVIYQMRRQSTRTPTRKSARKSVRKQRKTLTKRIRGGMTNVEFWKPFESNGARHFRKYVDNVPTVWCKNYSGGIYKC